MDIPQKEHDSNAKRHVNNRYPIKVYRCPDCLEPLKRTKLTGKYRCKSCNEVWEPDECWFYQYKCDLHGWFIDLDESEECPDCT